MIAPLLYRTVLAALALGSRRRGAPGPSGHVSAPRRLAS